MPFVLVDRVRIENLDKAREALHAELIPMTRQAPGFVRGTWSADRDAGVGIGVVVFETREQAEAVQAMAQSGDSQLPEGVTIEDSAIYEVQGEA